MGRTTKINKKNVALLSVVVLASLMFLLSEPRQVKEAEQAHAEERVLPGVAQTAVADQDAKSINDDLNSDIFEQSADSKEGSEEEEVLLSDSDYIQNLREREERNSYHDKLLADYDRHNRYPEYNQRIDSIETDPIERSYALDERTSQNEDGTAHLTIWTDKKYYLHGDEVVVYAILEDARGVRLQTRFAGQLIYDERDNLQQFEFIDTDSDGIYEHRLTLGPNSQAMPSGIYKVLIVNDTNEMVNAVAFTLSQPEIELTGNFNDSIDSQGSLLVQAEVNVTKQQRFYFQASLYSSTNDPIGVTQYSTELTPGKHLIPLSFDGLMIRDAGEPGPYLLKSLSLAKVAFPMEKAPLIYPQYYTSGYTLDEFQGANFIAQNMN